jgi:hypothetical protein
MSSIPACTRTNKLKPQRAAQVRLELHKLDGRAHAGPSLARAIEMSTDIDKIAEHFLHSTPAALK